MRPMSGIQIFSLAGVSVSVTGWYLILMLYLGASGGGSNGILWAGAVTFSILVHEFGHAGVAKFYSLSPAVVLHGWGGLCQHERAERDLHDAFILAAGPLAGLLLGGLVLVGSYSVGVVDGTWLARRPLAQTLVLYLLEINFVWSLANLLPLWPLDGGQLFRLGLLRVFRPARAERVTHVVGLVLGAGGAVLAWKTGHNFVAFLAAMLAWQNVGRLNSTGASGAIRSQNHFAKELLGRAQEAMAAQDWGEAVRLGHQMRADSNLDAATLSTVWGILGVANMALGRVEEAMDYLERASPEPAVLQAKAQGIIALGRASDAVKLLEHPGAHRLDSELRQGLELLARSASPPG